MQFLISKIKKRLNDIKIIVMKKFWFDKVFFIWNFFCKVFYEIFYYLLSSNLLPKKYHNLKLILPISKK